ncbi:hypothetical protein V1525DRAFT_410552 [Lipomyces kononenkoae]|uniref:Uncharacterized protein n=1 Tax=Lipomyces kononenkoae TaxID=34357 RepID=A0ACC3SUH8_LIPKO
MASVTPVILILGAGANIGQHLARAFAAQGYKVAVTARRVKESDSTADQLNITGDLSDPHSVVDAFSKVKSSLGIPSVVVYNAAAVTPNPPNNPLAIPTVDFSRDLTINTTSVFVAAQQAAEGFAQLPDSASRTFIYTGNACNTIVIPSLMDLSVGKSATAQIIQTAAGAYKDRGFKFYYGDERKADGSPAYGAIDGEAHAKLYLELAEGKTQGPWQQTFVKGVGYKKF